MINNKEFVWTDELACEFYRFMLCAGKMEMSNKSYLERFKESKQRTPVFVTQDGEPLYEGYEGDLWRVFTCNSSYESWKPYNLGMPKWINIGELLFLSEEKANEFVLLNKPCLSLNDIKWWLEKYFNYPDGINVNQLKEFVQEKINDKA